FRGDPPRRAGRRIQRMGDGGALPVHRGPGRGSPHRARARPTNPDRRRRDRRHGTAPTQRGRIMKCSTVGLLRSAILAAVVFAPPFVGRAVAQTTNIVGYSPSQPSPLNPTGPNVHDPRFDRFTTNFGKFAIPNTDPPPANR